MVRITRYGKKMSALIIVLMIAVYTVIIAAEGLIGYDRVMSALLMLLFLLVILGLVVFTWNIGAAEAELMHDRLKIYCPVLMFDIFYNEIWYAELRYSMDLGIIMGKDSTDLVIGKRRNVHDNRINSEFGKFGLYAKKSLNRFIVLHHRNGIVVFNLRTADETSRFYLDLRTRCGFSNYWGGPHSTESGGRNVSSGPEIRKKKRDSRKLWCLILSVATLIITVPFIIVGIFVDITVTIFMSFFAAMIILSLYSSLRLLRKTDIWLEDDGVGITGRAISMKIPYHDITSLEMRDELDPGSFCSGSRVSFGFVGILKNSEFGKYKLALMRLSERCIIMHHGDGEVIVFNFDSVDETSQFYSFLRTKVPKSARSP